MLHRISFEEHVVLNIGSGELDPDFQLEVWGIHTGNRSSVMIIKIRMVLVMAFREYILCMPQLNILANLKGWHFP